MEKTLFEPDLSLELRNILIVHPQSGDLPIDLKHSQGEMSFDRNWIRQDIGRQVTSAGLPIARVVTRFRLRHWSHWQIDYGALGALFHALPRLRKVRIETEKPMNEQVMLRQARGLC